MSNIAPPTTPTIFQFWHDERPPAYIQELVDSWIANSPEFTHRLFHDESAGDLIRQNFGERHYKAYLSCRLPAMRADLFRLCILYLHGGVYVDADQSCRASIYSLYQSCDRGCLHVRLYFQLAMIAILNGFMIVKDPMDLLLGQTLEIATRNIENRISNNVWDITGPGILNDLWENGDVALFDGFRLINEKQIRRLIAFHPQLPYKQTGRHWLEVQRSEPVFADSDTGAGAGASVLDGIDLLLPSLARATEFLRCAATVAPEGPDTRAIVAQITGSAARLAHDFKPSADPAESEQAVGELLFAVTNLAIKMQVEPEGALRRATAAFERRLRDLERVAAAQTRSENHE